MPNVLRFATQQLMDCPEGCNTYMMWWQEGYFRCPHCGRSYEVVWELKEVSDAKRTSKREP